jgi:hypothetical protein
VTCYSQGCDLIVPVALTPDQVREQSLPSTPLKDTERRADRWREAFGVDQTEIDALTIPQNAHILRNILECAFEPYIDATLAQRVRAAEAEWNDAAQEALAEQISDDTLAELRREATVRLDELRSEIERSTISSSSQPIMWISRRSKFRGRKWRSALQGKPWCRSTRIGSRQAGR